MRYTGLVFVATLLNLAAVPAITADPAEVASQLDGPLTPVGAQRAGNAAGTIPAWTGGIRTPPPGFEVGEHHPDPFPEDTVQFAINAGNLDQYTANLTEGQQALLRAYPDSWYLNVYTSRRTAAYPDFVYEAIKTNALQAQLETEGRGGVLDARISSAFPLPDSGLEVVWNHLLRFRGMYLERYNGQVPVTRLGRFRPILMEERVAFPYSFNYDHPIKVRFPSMLAAFKQKIVSPGALAGFGQLTLEPWNFTNDDRKTWVYSPNLRRVFRTPFAGYDNPAPNTDGLRFADENDMFNGSPYLFNWTLKGKREIYVPYNAYRLHSNEHEYEDLFHQGHINPALARYELHRVWVVEGVLNEAAKRSDIGPGRPNHRYQRRVFYLDEDSWQIVLAEGYDHEGELWRVNEGHVINYYEVPLLWTTMEVVHDLKQRRYVVGGVDNQRPMIRFSETGNVKNFSPNALKYYVR